jgi:hypothetical protein
VLERNHHSVKEDATFVVEVSVDHEAEAFEEVLVVAWLHRCDDLVTEFVASLQLVIGKDLVEDAQIVYWGLLSFLSKVRFGSLNRLFLLICPFSLKELLVHS